MNLSLQQEIALERRKLTLTEFAEHFEILLNEKHNLEFRLTKAVDEAKARTQLYHQALNHFDTERDQLKLEIATLRERLGQYEAVDGQHSVAAAKERLVRDEFERKFQEHSLEAKRERAKLSHQVQVLKKQLANCICRPSR